MIRVELTDDERVVLLGAVADRRRDAVDRVKQNLYLAAHPGPHVADSWSLAGEWAVRYMDASALYRKLVAA